MIRRFEILLLCTSALAGLSLAGIVVPAGEAAAQSPVVNRWDYASQGKSDWQVKTSRIAVGENTEKAQSDADPGGVGFSISVDGERLVGDDTVGDTQRRTDIALSNVDIQIKFDGLDVRPILNVATTDLRHSYGAGERIRFNVTTNYPGWIRRAEVRIYDAETAVIERPLEVVAVVGTGEGTTWTMPASGSGEYIYVLRVYDDKGRFDETVPLKVRRTGRNLEGHATSPAGLPVSAGRGEDRTATRNIPIYGGSITVFGRNVPDGHEVSALGETIPTDATGAFVMQRILPPGEHDIDVSVTGRRDGKLAFSRQVNIPENEWFYVGLADLTAGRRIGSKHVVDAAPGEFDRNYAKGRLAFYLKGKIKGRYLLTASADTGEEKVENLFRNLDDKGPQDLLRRIDPDRYYPVYGDGSTAIEDAPTDGKFYIRLERDGSHVMWGRYKTTIQGTEFARNQRQLYGAHGLYRSQTTTRHGDARVGVEAYVSRPGTLPQRDNMRGTGGSAYFLSRQDVNRGSETITIEVRDEVSGMVLSRRPLRYGQDYEINYVQGVVLLKQPLASSAGREDIVAGEAINGNAQYLVVQYEFTPALGEVKGYSSGGRGEAWVTDNVRIGASGINEQTGAASQKVIAGDVHVRLGKNSYVEGEVARTDGPGFSSTSSINGGLTLTEQGTAGRRNRKAMAERAKVQLDLQDLGLAKKGAVGAYYERRDGGFSSLGYNTLRDQRIFGAAGDVELRDDVRFKLKYKNYWSDNGQTEQEGVGEVEYDWDEAWTVGVGLKLTDVTIPGLAIRDGGRADVGVKVAHKFDDDHSLYVFGQGTARRTGNISRNDRGGIGGEVRVSDKIGLSGEVSYGTLGWGGLAAVSYDPTPEDRNYFGYKLDPERSLSLGRPLVGTDYGRFVIGAKHKYSESVSGFAENNYDAFGVRQSLTSTYGVVYTPTPLWAISGGVEYGEIQDPTGLGDIERTAPSLSVVYKDGDLLNWRFKSEVRFEDSGDPRKDRNTYLAAAGFSVATDDDWRFLTGIDAVISDSNQASLLDGDYVKGSVGYAYRPVEHDWVNGLFKFIFIYDLPGPDQVDLFGNKLGPAQRSFILSADANIDITPYLTVGAKYGFRIGEVSQTRSAKDFVASSAHLAVLRADMHIVKSWDFLLEARVLHTPEIETTNFGLVTGVYRHLNDNLKLGVGYNFGRFSDDVSDLTHDDGGVFVNVVGKF